MRGEQLLAVVTRVGGEIGNTRSSAVRKNFSAAASSRKPITTFTLSSQPPDFGSAFSSPGTSASTKNGAANAVAKASPPRISRVVGTAMRLPPPRRRRDAREPAQERAPRR